MNYEDQLRESGSFERGYPTLETARTRHDDQDLQRAVEAYRFFYPTVSMEGAFNGNRELGIEDGEGAVVLSAGPRHVIFTANSDTPYASAVVDLGTMGPVVIDLPPGPYIGFVNDHNQRWILDMGLPGPDGGRGGKHLVLPPDFAGRLPDEHFVSRSPTFKALVAVRALPHDGDLAGALDALRRVKIDPLSDPSNALPYVDVTAQNLDGTLLRWEDNLEYWRRLHAIIDAEPALDEFRPMYGELAALHIEKGKPFTPDARMRRLLEDAAKMALDEMKVEGFSQRPDCLIWKDRQWEWIALGDDANFESKDFMDLEARDRWFVMAVGSSPAMVKRQVGAGSTYFLAVRDDGGAFLDGGVSYALRIPQPVPARLFWSVTAYDSRTRSQVQSPQDKAVLSSLHGMFQRSSDGSIELYFGPRAPEGREKQWIQTMPGTGFFLCMRVYGPEAPCFDGTWRPDDVKRVEARVTRAPRMATEALRSVSTPDIVETAAGKLTFADGVPSEDTVAKIYDHLDLMHGVEAFQNAFQAVSMYSIRKGMLDIGVGDHDVLLFSRLMDSASLFLTANCDTVYFFTFLDLEDGPVVVEVPPRVLGLMNDMWFRWLGDIGLPGPDRGEGGRYLVAPRNYAGPLPDAGYCICRSSTTHVALLGRAFLEENDPAPAVARIRTGFKIYPYVPGGYGTSIGTYLTGDAPLAVPAGAPAPRFVEGSGVAMNTLPPNDVSFYDVLDAVVQLEPAEALEPEIAGQLAAIGIVKGEPFRPDARAKKLLAESVALGNAAARTVGMRARPAEGYRYYGAESAWMNPLFVGGYDFLRPPPNVTPEGVQLFPNPGARTLHARTGFFYVATGITPAMCMRLTGIGSQYLVAFSDAAGEPFDGAKTYDITLPPNVPAVQFWSLTLYDNQTRSMLQTEQLYPRAGSQSYPSPAAVAASDGSTTVYMGPTRPPGVPRGNWIQTVPGKGWFIALRLYGPLRSFFDKSWRPSEIERTDGAGGMG